jgi:hypothetical protein
MFGDTRKNHRQNLGAAGALCALRRSRRCCHIVVRPQTAQRLAYTDVYGNSGEFPCLDEPKCS